MGQAEGQAQDDQQADEGGSVWDWDDGDADCGWAVDDHDEKDDEVYMIHTDARYFTPSPEEEDEDSESEEEEEEEKDKEECVEEYKYKVVDGRTLFGASDEASEGCDFTDVLSPTPNRGLSAGPDSSVDPWSAGVDPWICASTAGSSSRFAEKYRVAATPTDAQGFAERFRSPLASTLSAAATRVLFESPASESGSDSPIPRFCWAADAPGQACVDESVRC